MIRILKKAFVLSTFTLGFSGLNAQTFNWISSTEGNTWQERKVKLHSSSTNAPILRANGTEHIVTFKKWGTCFNELGWDALNILSMEDQEKVLDQLFSPDGDMKFTMGRISMNANDYARNWYSCDEVPGDFKLKYFNIDRDKKTLIPYVKRVLKKNPHMTFWISPWSPPSWMKVNNYYSVRSDAKVNRLPEEANIALYEGKDNEDKKFYPNQVTENDYMIQDPRYLQAYADYFVKFVQSYKEMGINIGRVMFQNEPWAYSIYPACAWTPDGIIRFNVEYLVPTVKKNLPGVEVYLGTLNTNRIEYVQKILEDPRMKDAVEGIGFQWWGGQILPKIREQYPNYKYVQTENECGWGKFSWKDSERTFELMNHYLGNGCEEYTFWNAILCDRGTSSWGWNQNAMLRINSATAEITYTPEYFAAKHFCNKVVPGTKILAFKEPGDDKLPAMILQTPDGKFLVIAGNFNDESKKIIVELAGKYLEVELDAHSYNTFCAK